MSTFFATTHHKQTGRHHRALSISHRFINLPLPCAPPPTAQSLIHEGSLVPKTLYLSTIEEHSIATSTTNGKQHASSPQPSQPLSSSSSSTAKSSTPKTGTALATRQQQQNSSLYKSVLLEPGHLYELVLRNDDPKSVLTWDFDVVTGCMQFAVLRIVGAPALPLNGNDGECRASVL